MSNQLRTYTSRMLKMRPSFFSVVAALVFTSIGFGLGWAEYSQVPVSVGAYVAPAWMIWAGVGAAFLLAFTAIRMA